MLQLVIKFKKDDETLYLGTTVTEELIERFEMIERAAREFQPNYLHSVIYWLEGQWFEVQRLESYIDRFYDCYLAENYEVINSRIPPRFILNPFGADNRYGICWWPSNEPEKYYTVAEEPELTLLISWLKRQKLPIDSYTNIYTYNTNIFISTDTTTINTIMGYGDYI